MKTDRRSFLRISGAAGAAAAALGSNSIELVAQASRALGNRTPDDVAADESYWRDIQSAFTLDRSLINLNNGNSCPSPTVVHEAYKRYLDYSNQAPVYHRGLIERNIEVVRRRLAAEFGCDAEEMAITRNSSESLQIAQNGLDLAPGDEVLTTEQDYGRMLTTWDQRARRDKLKITKINFPVPTTGEELFGRLEGAITPRTKVLHFCHITNLTGQIFPVQNISRMARARGIITIVDGAHAVAHFPFKLRDLEMDYYGTSLHKWLLAPTGTGFLYVRRERSPAATKAAINEALAFHQAIGTERVAARLRYLTLRWANKLKADPKIQIHTGLDQVYGVACVGVKDVPAPKIYDFLWNKYRIITAAISRPEYNGVRVTPNIYTPLEEIDTFVAAMEDLLKNGVPAA
jgi:isopenicillin-N epimerase